MRAALQLAERDSWSQVRMMHVASYLNVSIAEILRQFPDMDAISNFWFEQASLILGEQAFQKFEEKSPKERLVDVIMLWFSALEPHRRVTAEMIAEKLYLSHPHHWGPLVFNLSRLVHLFLDVALINSHGNQRRIEELGITFVLISTFRVWSCDQSEVKDPTRRYLLKQLAWGERIMYRFF